jgi:hypothetical protein
MDLLVANAPIQDLPIKLFERILEIAWLKRDLNPETKDYNRMTYDIFYKASGYNDHIPLYNTLSLVSRSVRKTITRIAWQYVFIDDIWDIIRYHHLYHGSAALGVATLGPHLEFHIYIGWLLNIEQLIKKVQDQIRSNSSRKVMHIINTFVQLLESAPTHSGGGVISLRDGTTKLHIWNGQLDAIDQLQAYDTMAAHELRQLWLYGSGRPAMNLSSLWADRPSPCPRIERLSVQMMNWVTPTWGKHQVPFNIMYPSLRILELNVSTSLVPLMPLLPATLETLVLDVPAGPGAPHGAVYLWSLARCLREWKGFKTTRKPGIVLRTGKEQPAGWDEALTAATMVGVPLKRVVVFL